MAKSPKFRYAAMTVNDRRHEASFLFRVENDDPNTYRAHQGNLRRRVRRLSEAAKTLDRSWVLNSMPTGHKAHQRHRRADADPAPGSLSPRGGRQDQSRSMCATNTNSRPSRCAISSGAPGPRFLAKDYTAAPLPTHVPPQENPEKQRGARTKPPRPEDRMRRPGKSSARSDQRSRQIVRVPPAPRRGRKRKLSDEQIGMLLANHATKRASYYQLAEQYRISARPACMR